MHFLEAATQNATIDRASTVILPVPYDASVCYQPGSRWAPERIISASNQMELLDEETGTEPIWQGIHTLNPLEVPVSPELLVDLVASKVRDTYDPGKLYVTIGGDHSVSIGAIQALSDIYNQQITVIQFDAHADLRDEYQGTKFSHACVMRRAYECTSKTVQIGIRSISKKEMEFAQQERLNFIWAKNIYNDTAKAKRQLINILDSDPVYITIDMDCLDPSIMPAVGTPEPGGLDWYQLIDMLRTITSKANVIGFDVVELCPIPSMISCDYITARLIYKLIAYILQDRK